MASQRSSTEPRRVNNIRLRPYNGPDNVLLNNWCNEPGRSNRPAKKDNPEREREATLSRDSTPLASKQRVHTPHTYPRTKQAAHMRALEHLRQTLVFNDETSGNENEDPLDAVSVDSDRGQSPDSGVLDATTDSNQIVGRLMQIRDYLKQATSMAESLDKDSPNSQEQLSKLNRLVQHLKEQEEGYLALLQKMLADRSPGSEILNNQRELNNIRSPAHLNGDIRLPHANGRPDPGTQANGRPGPGAQDNGLDDDYVAGNESDASLDVDAASEISESTTQSDKEAEVKALRKQRDLLKKMLDQQRMLKSLHERQAELLELQRKTDNSEESANHKPSNTSEIRDASYTRGGNPILSDEDKDRDEMEQEEEEEAEDDESSSSDSDTVEESANGYDEPPPTEEEAEVPAELQALRDRLQHLKHVFDQNLSQQFDDQQKLETLRQMQVAVGEAAVDSSALSEASSTVEGAESECSNPERRKLKHRLDQLQDKKGKMEQLLGELEVLRGYRKHNHVVAADDTSASESTATGEVIRDMREQTVNAAVTAGQAETVLDVMEQESKLRRLEEVRGRLDQLRDLVQYYQAGNEFIHADADEETDGEDTTSNNESEPITGQDLSLRSNLLNVMDARKLSGMSESTDDTESNLSLGDFGNDPEIQEKVRKLQSARERLARLQSLVSMVQQWPESAEVLPEDLAELAATAINDTASECSTTSKASTTSGAQSFSNLYDKCRQTQQTYNLDHKPVTHQTASKRQASNQQPSNGLTSNQQSSQPSNQQLASSARANQNAVENAREEREDTQSVSDSDSRAESEAFYLQRMNDQKLELQKLMDERNKLIKIQNELKSLHHQYTESGPQDLQRLLNSNSNAISEDTEASSVSTNGRANPSFSQNGNKGGAARASVTFSANLHNGTPGDPANDDLYSRMLEQRMKRLESPKSKGDEDQMTADVTTLATWGDSESSSSDSSSEGSESDDEDTPNDEGEIDEDNDGYPSDGIVQVEEEEEANRDSDRDTYTVEDEYQFRQRYPANVKSKPGRPRRPHTHKLKEAGNPGAGDYWKPAQSSTIVPATSRVTAAAHGSGTDMISKMKDQLDATTDMCQHLLEEQRKLTCQLRGDYQTQGSEPWQENRLIYSVNQLFSQVMDMQAALQVTVDQVYAITQHLDEVTLESSASTIRPELANKSNSAIPAARSMSGLPNWARPRSDWTPQVNARPAADRRPWSVDPRYLNRGTQMGGDERTQSDGERTPTQQIPPQNSGRSEATTEPDSKTESARQYFEHNYSIPPLDLDKLIRRRQEQSRSLQSTGRTYPSPSLSAIAAGRVRVPLDSMYKPGISSGICGTAYADTASVSSAVSSIRDLPSGNTTPTADTPTKQGAWGAAGGLSNTATTPLQDRRERDSAASELSMFEALRETIYSEVATLISQNENRPHFLIEMFRELQMLSSDYLRQRGLYSIQELVTKFLTEDVASLQMKLDSDEAESDGDFLNPRPVWMLYRTAGSEETPTESCVTTDNDEDVKQMLDTQHPITPVHSSANFNKLQRVGSIKSDFADYIEQVETTSTHSTSHSQTGSAWEDPFNRDSLGDTVIHLEQARLLGSSSAAAGLTGRAAAPVVTPSATSLASASVHWGSESSVSDVSHDIPFACNSPLGDTAIDLQEAMQKVKDIDRRKEAKREARKDQPKRTPHTDSSSSAHDETSDNDEIGGAVQMTTIDTQMLDRRIKQIMTEIIPILREHMDNVCSSQLLQYLQEKVIGLTEQTGDEGKPERAAEFSQFFRKQLFNILKDSLAKFEGRRMRDCGEEILVDISEILFNELAFFKLMQDLDDPDVKDRLALNKWRAEGEVPQDEGDNTETEDETTRTSTVDQSEDYEGAVYEADPAEAVNGGEGDEMSMEGDETSQEGGSAEEEDEGEEENLGKDRDDAFADEVNTATSHPTFTDVHFELAPSETKPMTRIGSDEDCSGEEDDTSEFSTDDGDDTAISRQTAQDQVLQEPVKQSGATEQSELEISDLPSKLNVDLDAIAAKAADESAQMSADADIELEDELAGSSTELKEPTASSTEPTAQGADDIPNEGITEKQDEEKPKRVKASPDTEV